MHEVFLGQSYRKFNVPGWGPDQLNRCEVAAEISLLTCSHRCSHISWYNTIGFLLPCGCNWITFWKNSHPNALCMYVCESRDICESWHLCISIQSHDTHVSHDTYVYVYMTHVCMCHDTHVSRDTHVYMSKSRHLRMRHHIYVSHDTYVYVYIVKTIMWVTHICICMDARKSPNALFLYVCESRHMCESWHICICIQRHDTYLYV